MTRRLLITVEAESHIILRDDSQDPNVAELERRFLSADLSIRDLATEVGTSDGFTPRAVEVVGVDLEEQCELHPDVWFDVNAPKKRRNCWKCQADERERRGQ